MQDGLMIPITERAHPYQGIRDPRISLKIVQPLPKNEHHSNSVQALIEYTLSRQPLWKWRMQSPAGHVLLVQGFLMQAALRRYPREKVGSHVSQWGLPPG